MSAPSGKGFMQWLGRQVGYVRTALKTDVSDPKVVYQKKDVMEAEHPTDPNLKLRRTVIDEVVEEKRKDEDVKREDVKT